MTRPNDLTTPGYAGEEELALRLAGLGFLIDARLAMLYATMARLSMSGRHMLEIHDSLAVPPNCRVLPSERNKLRVLWNHLGTEGLTQRLTPEQLAPILASFLPVARSPYPQFNRQTGLTNWYLQQMEEARTERQRFSSSQGYAYWGNNLGVQHQTVETAVEGLSWGPPIEVFIGTGNQQTRWYMGVFRSCWDRDMPREGVYSVVVVLKVAISDLTAVNVAPMFDWIKPLPVGTNGGGIEIQLELDRRYFRPGKTYPAAIPNDAVARICRMLIERGIPLTAVEVFSGGFDTGQDRKVYFRQAF